MESLGRRYESNWKRGNRGGQAGMGKEVLDLMVAKEIDGCVASFLTLMT